MYFWQERLGSDVPSSAHHPEESVMLILVVIASVIPRLSVKVVSGGFLTFLHIINEKIYL